MTNPTELVKATITRLRSSIYGWENSSDLHSLREQASDLIESLVAERDTLRQELLTANCQYEDWTKERTALKAKLEVARGALQSELDYQFNNYREVAPWIRKALAALQGE